jgi:hypothetical protein
MAPEARTWPGGVKLTAEKIGSVRAARLLSPRSLMLVVVVTGNTPAHCPCDSVMTCIMPGYCACNGTANAAFR